MGGASIFWYLLHLLSSKIWNSFHTFTYLELHQDILYYMWLVWSVFSLISVSVYLSFVYMRAIDSFKLILFLATLLKVFISFQSSLEEFWGHLCILSYHLPITILWIFLSNLYPPISLSCLTALARTSSTLLLNK